MTDSGTCYASHLALQKAWHIDMTTFKLTVPSAQIFRPQHTINGPSTASGRSKPGHACPTSARQCPRPTPVTDTRRMARTPRIDMQLPQPEAIQRTANDGRYAYNDIRPSVALPGPLYLTRPSPRASTRTSHFPILVQAQRILGVDKPAPPPGSIREQPCGR